MSSAYLQGFKEGLKPDPLLTVTEWADKHRVLSTIASAEHGKWRTSRTPFLKEIMDNLSITSEFTEVVFMKGTQVGGALSLDTPIPTPSGWTTMGEIKKGDLVFDEKGGVAKVTFKSEVYKKNDCYKITFSDGTEVISDNIHRWPVTTYKGVDKILWTPDIAKSFKVGSGKKARCKYSVRTAGPLVLDKKKLPIEPYLLGVWLGDGNRHTGLIYLNKKDAPEILDKISREVRTKLDSENCLEVVIKDFYKELRVNKFLKEKAIPIEYLRASIEQRLELLKGLMDTDGSISKSGRCEYSSVDWLLVEGVYELLVSLGFKPTIYEVESKLGHNGNVRKSEPRPLWRISFTSYDNRIFNLKRKKARIKKEGRILETKKRYIVSVEKINPVPTACIEVDSKSHLYLCSRAMIPTHNTECGNNFTGYVIDYAPGPFMSVMPRVDDAKKNSKIRLQPLIDSSPRLKEKVKEAKSRDSGNTLLQKDFPGGMILLTGANSAAGLRSVPVRYLFLDEVDAYPGDVEGEGDPIDLAKKRTDTFSNKKRVFMVSTPTIEGRSKIEHAYNKTDQRKYFVPCPECDHYQWLQWGQLKWEPGKPETVYYECEECSFHIKNWHKTKMLERGEWRATSEGVDSKTVGYHLSGLYSPVGWFSWEDAVKQWEAAHNPKNLEKLKTFINTVLGETWKDKGEAPDWKRLYNRRENYEIGSIPNGVCFLTAGVDIQTDRIECEIVGWARNKVSYSIDYRVFYGDTSSINQGPWLELQSTLSELWETEGGFQLPIRLMAVDSGWNTQTVYSWVRQFSISKVIAVKGSDFQSTVISTGTAVDVKTKGGKVKQRKALKLFTLGVSVIKQEFYGWLRLEKETQDEPDSYGYCHFPQYDEEHFKRLTSETLEVKWVKGKKVYQWVANGRNEQLDCRVYARAAASLAGMDRFKDQHWTRLESEAGVVLNKKGPEKEAKSDEKPAPIKVKRPKIKIKRRKSRFS